MTDTYVYAQVDFGPDGNPPTLVIENADRSLVMSDATYTACASYLERLGAAEYRSFVAARRRKSERYAPTPYHAESHITPDAPEWSGSPCPIDPDNYWIDDATGERIAAR
jgi:hypothetical protein